MAKSTFCRKCSDYFSITPAVVVGAGSALVVKQPAPPRSPTSAPVAPAGAPRESIRSVLAPIAATPPPAAGSGLREKLGGLLGSKPKTRVAHCFECASWHEISSSAQSTTCKACGAYIDLQDYKISGSFSRNIRTRGTLYLGSKGDLSSSKIVCAHATIHGKMRGNLTCPGKVTIKVQGRLNGSVEAGHLVVEKGSEVVFARPLHAANVEIHGVMTGQVVSDTHVIISRSGSLDGAVDATGFNVEKGGCFQGELTIRPRGSGDLPLPEPTSAQPVAAQHEDHGLLGGEQQPAMV